MLNVKPMLKSALRYIELTARAKTGLTVGVVVAGFIALIALAIAFVLLIVAAYIWLQFHIGALHAALVLAGAFALVGVIALLACMLSHRRTAQRARIALAARRSTPLLDPTVMAMGLQVSRAIGWRRIAPLVAVGLLGITIAREVATHLAQSDEHAQKDRS